MKGKNKLQTVVTITYIAVFLLFFVFAIYMYCAEHNSVYRARTIDQCEIVKDYTEVTIDDSSAPVGIRKEYSWKLSDISTTKDCLAFYIVHTYAEVYIDGELVYSITPNENNLIGDSPSSNWIFIPLNLTDNGRDVQVTVTPVYKSVINRKIEFIIGNRYDIVVQCLRLALPQIILSLLCIFIGLAIMLVQQFFILRKKINSRKIFYLGNFVLLVGIWRITDTRFSPIMFSENPMALGYVTILALFICYIPFLLFFKEYFMGSQKTYLLLTAFVGCIITLIALICQVFHIADVRETLFLCHIMLIISILVIILVSFLHMKTRSDKAELYTLVLMILPGVLFDLLFFYLNKSSSGAIFTVFALLIYTIVRVIIEIFNINRKVYIDAQTGLFNRNRWNNLMNKPELISGVIGVMMLDLNRLKHINDTLGHQIGDKMIHDFADILRKIFHTNCMIFRWGGDEFTVLVLDADREKIDRYISEISVEVDAHNSSGEKPEIHFAVGYALSTDYPTLSHEELMKKADEKMYHNKSEWYHKNVPEYRL